VEARRQAEAGRAARAEADRLAAGLKKKEDEYNARTMINAARIEAALAKKAKHPRADPTSSEDEDEDESSASDSSATSLPKDVRSPTTRSSAKKSGKEQDDRLDVVDPQERTQLRSAGTTWDNQVRHLVQLYKREPHDEDEPQPTEAPFVDEHVRRPLPSLAPRPQGASGHSYRVALVTLPPKLPLKSPEAAGKIGEVITYESGDVRMIIGGKQFYLEPHPASSCLNFVARLDRAASSITRLCEEFVSASLVPDVESLLPKREANTGANVELAWPPADRSAIFANLPSAMEGADDDEEEASVLATCNARWGGGWYERFTTGPYELGMDPSLMADAEAAQAHSMDVVAAHGARDALAEEEDNDDVD
jgi:hypothetical protein